MEEVISHLTIIENYLSDIHLLIYNSYMFLIYFIVIFIIYRLYKFFNNFIFGGV